MNARNTVVEKAREYYDSSDADNFYFHIWGGEDIHIGWYLSPEEDIFRASRRTVQRMAGKVSGFMAGAKVLDIGAGYGGSARVLARDKGYHVTCLNLSEVQNERNREMNVEQNLATLVDVVDGSFEELPFDDGAFDVVWSQDAILHSGNREKVFSEVDRTLKPGGEFIFTDPMQTPGVSKDLLKPVLDRIHLSTMGSVETYEEYARGLGWETVGIEPANDKLVAHYSRVLDELNSRENEMSKHCSQDYINRMKQGLEHWISAGKQKALAWGILHFRKPGLEQ